MYFFAALFIVQLLYGMMAVSAGNNNRVEYEHVKAEYDYHMALRDLNQDQANYIFNDSGQLFKNDMIFDLIRYEKSENINGRIRYDLYIFFLGDKDLSEERFRENYIPSLQALARSGESFYLSASPLLRFVDNERTNLVVFIVITLVLLAVSIFLLTALYNIRVNQYKFTYGVYMTFGADFRRLFATAFWELFVISTVTLIPAAVLSNVVVWGIYSAFGIAFSVSYLSLLWIALFTLVVTLVSVWMPMRVMALKQPMSLIVTEDNSNLVTSPRRSINLLRKTFPRDYEFSSIWRFRKYSVQLLSTAIVFCALFICGLYLADIYTRDLEYSRPQFTVDVSATGLAYDEIMCEELYALEGITEVEAMNSTKALHLASHMVTDGDNVLSMTGVIQYKSPENPMEGHCATNETAYFGMSRDQVKVLQKYSYSGDLQSVFEKENTVIIGDSISNVPTFEFEVGDTILISKKTGHIKTLSDNLTGENLLRNQIEYFHFDYYPFTVGAVLHDIPSGELPIFFNVEDYETITGESGAATKINLYIDQSMTPEEVTVLERQLWDWGRSLYGDVKISNTHQLNLDNIAKDKHYNELYICIAVLILMISPLVWFFSQTLYYYKREREFNILQSLGAPRKSIRSIYLQGGLIMAALSLGVALLLSYAGSYAMFYMYNVVIPYFTNEHVRYPFYMPWYAILISIIVSVGCGFLSSYLPFRSYVKSRFTLENGGAGESED